MAPDYSKGKIYKLESITGGSCYIGSTCQSLQVRFAEHKRQHTQFLKGNRNYTTSAKILENSDAMMTLLENYQCNSRKELLNREGEWIRKIDCVNKHIPGRTQREYYQDNKDNILQRHKKLYQDNKDEIQRRKSIKINCGCGGKYTISHKALHATTDRHMIYVKNNK
jgi:hypothetical protein